MPDAGTCSWCARVNVELPWPNTCTRCFIEKLPQINHDHRLDKTTSVLKWLAGDEDGRAWMVKELQARGYVILPPQLVEYLHRHDDKGK